MMINELKELFFTRIQENTGKLFQENGFKLRKHKWVKKQGNDRHKVIQEINFYVAINPKYHPNAILHIKPTLYILFPEINRIAFEIFKDNESLLYNNEDITFGQPVSLLLPKGNNEEIYIGNDNDSFLDGVLAMEKRLNDSVLPFFNDCNTIKKFTELYTNQDKRLVYKQAPYYVFQVIAFTLLNETSKAMQVVDKQFNHKSMEKYREILYAFISR